MKGGWRHGVVGVQNAMISSENAANSTFYKDVMGKKQQEQLQKDAINLRRQKSKLTHFNYYL